MYEKEKNSKRKLAMTRKMEMVDYRIKFGGVRDGDLIMWKC